MYHLDRFTALCSPHLNLQCKYDMQEVCSLAVVINSLNQSDPSQTADLVPQNADWTYTDAIPSHLNL